MSAAAQQRTLEQPAGEPHVTNATTDDGNSHPSHHGVSVACNKACGINNGTANPAAREASPTTSTGSGITGW